MSAPFILVAVYVCGYGVTAVMWGCALHRRADRATGEARAAFDQHPLLTSVWIGVVSALVGLVWPLLALTPWWRRELVGRA